MSLILAYKQRSETMSVCMDRIRREADIPGDVPMTYAGRLDPMAEGLVVFLYGDLRYKKDLFLKLPKTYHIEFFLGCTTDTYDVLGICTKTENTHSQPLVTRETVQSFQPEGTFVQKFPHFSSRKVFGKPLFHHTLENTHRKLPQQEHEVSIYRYDSLSTQSISRDVLIHSIIRDSERVVGNFRQPEIVTQWKKVAKELPDDITLYGLTLDCSSGFYVRQWVSDFGDFLGTGAVTFSIIRGTIGVFTMSMLNGESYRVFDEHDPLIHKLTI